jgi:transcriptional regulator with XRE-family HTH domain
MDDQAMAAKRLADAVLLHRVRSGLTVMAAAQRAGMSRTTWTDLENASRPIPRAETLGRVAAALGVDVAELLIAAGVISSPLRFADDAVELRQRLEVLVDQVAELAARVSEQADTLAQLQRRFRQGSG